jgi:hypothetical protein
MEVNRHHLKSPVEIITTQLGIPQNYKQQCIDEIYRIGDQQNNQTNVKAIMSTWFIWEETTVLNSLLNNIHNTLNKIIPINDKRYVYKLVDCWSAIYKKEHYTTPHNHKSILSFVYYLKVDNDSSILLFDKCNFNLQPQNDMLVIFPGYLTHSVPKQLSGEDRICLAGNMDLIQPK